MSCLFGKYFGTTFFILCMNHKVVIGLEFGCNFKNKNYDVDLGENTLNPIFGKEVTPLVIKGRESLNELLDKLKDIIGGELEKNLYNDVDRLFNFYDDFKSQEEPFRKFFDNWKPKLNPHEGTVEISLSLMEKLEKELPELKDHMYPAATINTDSTDYLSKLTALKVKTPGDLDVTPDGEPVIDHVSVTPPVAAPEKPIEMKSIPEDA